MDENKIYVRCLLSNNENEGCGELTDTPLDLSAPASITDCCINCGNRLLSSGTNAEGKRLYLGQTVFFHRYSNLTPL